MKGEVGEKSPYESLTPAAIDKRVMSKWTVIQPMLMEIKPWSSAAVGFFSFHAGAMAQGVKQNLDEKEDCVPPCYRYHR